MLLEARLLLLCLVLRAVLELSAVLVNLLLLGESLWGGIAALGCKGCGTEKNTG